MSLKCTTCGKPLEPTILKPKEELWCPLCAKYFDLEGKPKSDTFHDTMEHIIDKGPVIEKIIEASKPKRGRPPNQKPITVTIGETSFTGMDRVEFNVGQTRVVVT